MTSDLVTAEPEPTEPNAPAALTRSTGPRRRLRAAFLTIHRVTGFFLVIFLVVAGVTGTIITFQQELDAALNPRLFRAAPPTPEAQPLDPLTLRERAAAQLPAGVLTEMPLYIKPGYTVQTWLTDERHAFIDPYDGRVVGTRKWADFSEGLHFGIVQFIYQLHYALSLGEVGTWLLGVAALLWTFDCFVGAYLTFPLAQKRGTDGKPGKSWLRRWVPSWLLKTGQLFSSIFTFHRAAGLWLWAVLLVFAWTGVGFNLQPVFKPVMGVFGYRELPEEAPALPQPPTTPALDWRAAHATGKELLQTESTRRGFAIEAEGALGYDAERGRYSYRAYSSLDVGRRWPGTEVTFNANTGKLLAFHAPTGERAANTVATWLFALHMAQIGGLLYRIFVALLGLLIPALAISGIWIWWRKRQVRSSG